MVKIPEQVLTVILKNNNIVFVGSVDAKGIPNISPRFLLGVIDDEKLLFADLFKNKTYANLKAWKKVTVVAVDKESMGGFQLKGDAEEVRDKELDRQASAKLREVGVEATPVRSWTVSVNEIYSLKPSPSSKFPFIPAYG